MKHCDDIPAVSFDCSDNIIKRDIYRFEGEKVFRNEKPFGKVISRTDSKIKIKRESNNQYLNGMIIVFEVFNNGAIWIPTHQKDETPKQDKNQFCDTCGCLPENCCCGKYPHP